MRNRGRADKRNKLVESGNWRPGKWKPERVGMCVRHIYNRCEQELEFFLGTDEGRAVFQRLRSERNEVKSVAELRARGVPLLGDQNAEG